MSKSDAARLAEIFQYIDDLRDSGITNMWGATPYVVRAFGIDRDEASKAHTAWMKTFDGKTSLADRVATAEKSHV